MGQAKDHVALFAKAPGYRGYVAAPILQIPMGMFACAFRGTHGCRRRGGGFFESTRAASCLSKERFACHSHIQTSAGCSLIRAEPSSLLQGGAAPPARRSCPGRRFPDSLCSVRSRVVLKQSEGWGWKPLAEASVFFGPLTIINSLQRHMPSFDPIGPGSIRTPTLSFETFRTTLTTRQANIA